MDRVSQGLRDYYDAEAANRDEGGIQEWKRVERQRFVDAVAAAAAGNTRPRVLELGSGPGRDAQHFSDRCRFAVEALDLSPQMVARCERRGITARVCDFSDGLEAAASSVDAVFAMNSLLHVPKRKLPTVLADVARVLRPGGVFYAGLYGGEDFEGCWQADPSSPARFFAYYTDLALLALVPSDKFAVESFECVHPGASRGGSTQHHFQSLLLRRRAAQGTTDGADALSTYAVFWGLNQSVHCLLDTPTWALPLFLATACCPTSTRVLLAGHTLKLALDWQRCPKMCVHEILDMLMDASFCATTAVGVAGRAGLIRRYASVARAQLRVFWLYAALWKANRAFLDARYSCANVLLLSLVAEYLPFAPLGTAQALARAAPALALLVESVIALLLLTPREAAADGALALALLFHLMNQCLPNPFSAGFFGLSMQVRYFGFVAPELHAICMAHLLAARRGLAAVGAIRTSQAEGGRLHVGDCATLCAATALAVGLGWALLSFAVLRFGAEGGSTQQQDGVNLPAVFIYLPGLALYASALWRRREARRAGGSEARQAAPVQRPQAPRLCAIVSLLMALYGALPATGLRTLGTPNVFSSLHIDARGSNHLFVPSSWARHGYAAEVVRVEATTSRRIGNHVHEVSHLVPPRTRALLRDTGHGGRVFRVATLAPDYAHALPSPPSFVPFTLPSFELRVLLDEARAAARRTGEPFTLSYARLGGGADASGSASERVRVHVREWPAAERLSCRQVREGKGWRWWLRWWPPTAECAADELVYLPAPHWLLRRLIRFTATPDTSPEHSIHEVYCHDG